VGLKALSQDWEAWGTSFPNYKSEPAPELTASQASA
jgi:hypothetical protein